MEYEFLSKKVKILWSFC